MAQEIVISGTSTVQYVRALICGLPSSGKTTFAASAPRPLFLSDAVEGGYKTLFGMPRQYLWDPDVSPVIWPLERIVDMSNYLSKLEELARSGKFPYGTIVVDPLSTWMSHVLSEMETSKPGSDKRQLYGDLATNIRATLIRIHALPCHVLWLTHLENGNEINGPLLPGKTANQFPAFCDFKWICWAQTNVNAPTTYELRTKPFRSWSFAGSRGLTAYEIPDPLIPSWKAVAQVLGLTEKPASPAMPGFPDGAAYQLVPRSF
jgi:hypothetical protein